VCLLSGRAPGGVRRRTHPSIVLRVRGSSASVTPTGRLAVWLPRCLDGSSATSRTSRLLKEIFVRFSSSTCLISYFIASDAFGFAKIAPGSAIDSTTVRPLLCGGYPKTCLSIDKSFAERRKVFSLRRFSRRTQTFPSVGPPNPETKIFSTRALAKACVVQIACLTSSGLDICSYNCSRLAGYRRKGRQFLTVCNQGEIFSARRRTALKPGHGGRYRSPIFW
jgi:hypothetical protein